MFDELVKTVRLHLSERLTSPLLGAFIVSWSAWNYRLFLIVFSGERVERKFALIDHVVFPDLHQTLLRGLIFPIITSLAYLFIYPYPAKFVYSFTRRQQRAILEIRRRIEDETPLTVEDSRRIRSEFAKTEQEYFAELDRKDREIERLRTQFLPVNTAQEPEATSSSDSYAHADSSPPLEDALVRLLLVIEKLDGEAPEKAAIASSGKSRTEAEYILGELVRRGLAKRAYKSSREAYVYTFTHSGRAALLAAKRLQPASV